MKKILIILLAIGVMLMPLNTLALDNESTFSVGDSVSVSFNGQTNSQNLIGFHVLKASSAGESTVTLVYDGIMATHDSAGNIKEAQVLYQTPDTATGNASEFAGSNVKRFLDEAVAEYGWILASSARLLEASDLTSLGISKDADGTYTIPTKYDFLRPADFDSAYSTTATDYWTQITSGTSNVYIVTKDGTDKTNNISAKIVTKSVDPVTSSNNYSVKPVVVVNKQYIVCNNSKKSENVQTGIEDYFLLFGGIIALSTIGYVASKKKDAFQNI